MLRYCDRQTLEKLFEAKDVSACPVIPENAEVSSFLKNRYLVLPGLVDVHVHLREPGFSYKETVYSGTRACAAGGYTAVCTMPNLNPVPDTAANLAVQTGIIKRDAVISVYPYGAITKERLGVTLSDMDELSDSVIAFSDDGSGVQNDEMMLLAMKKAGSLNKIIAAHCEDNSLLNGGYIHDGTYAREHFHKGISSASEYRQIERDLKLVEQTGCSYHVCHISTGESVELIRQAKKQGLDVTCETAPHYLLLDDSFLQEDGRFKMNPPLRDKSDRLALLEGIADGTIDMIATDHAPHSAEEKGRGLQKSAMGVVGVETAFPLLYTRLAEQKIITLEKLVELMHCNPCRRFGIDTGNDFTVFDTNVSYEINSDEFLSKGRSTPFEGMTAHARCLLTVCGGKTAYSVPGFEEKYL